MQGNNDLFLRTLGAILAPGLALALQAQVSVEWNNATRETIFIVRDGGSLPLDPGKSVMLLTRTPASALASLPLVSSCARRPGTIFQVRWS
jgi:hypothetical protein